MSKSKGNVIELRMTADETAKKIKGARTDSDRQITYDPSNRPEVANLIKIISDVRGHRADPDRVRRSATAVEDGSRLGSPRP